MDDKEWESVEKPSLASSVLETADVTDAVDIDPETAKAAVEESEGKNAGPSAELVEEGVKVEAANLAEEEGVEVEKPAPGKENMLEKDW